MSEAYACEKREMRCRGQGEERKATLYSAILITSDISYEESETSRRPEPRTGAEDPPYSERFPTQPTYAVPPPQPAYSTEAGSATSPGSMYPSGSSYQPGPGYPATSGYLPPGHLASIRPSINDSNYIYGDEYINSGPSYRQASTYPSAGGYRDPREEPRTCSRAGPRDTRLDPRDSRTIPGYLPNVTSPRNMSMHGAVDDPGNYDYVSSIPPLQSGRDGSFGVAARGYDPHGSPQMRDGHGTNPIREERRARRGPRNHENEDLTGDLPMHDIKESGSGYVAGDTHRSEPVGEEDEGRLVQWFGEQLVEKDHGSIPKLLSNEDPLQVSVEKSDAIPDEESEWSGISSSDDDAVRQQSHIFSCYIQRYFLTPLPRESPQRHGRDPPNFVTFAALASTKIRKLTSTDKAIASAPRSQPLSLTSTFPSWRRLST